MIRFPSASKIFGALLVVLSFCFFLGNLFWYSQQKAVFKALLELKASQESLKKELDFFSLGIGSAAPMVQKKDVEIPPPPSEPLPTP